MVILPPNQSWNDFCRELQYQIPVNKPFKQCRSLTNIKNWWDQVPYCHRGHWRVYHPIQSVKESFSWWTAECYPGSIHFHVTEERVGNEGQDNLILPGAACHIFTKSNMLLFVGEQLSTSDDISYCPKKPKAKTKNPKQICWMTVMGTKKLEKPIPRLFSVHLLCTFHSTFDNVIVIFFSKLVCFLSSWGRKVYVNQALVIYSILLCP